MIKTYTLLQILATCFNILDLSKRQRAYKIDLSSSTKVKIRIFIIYVKIKRLHKKPLNLRLK